MLGTQTQSQGSESRGLHGSSLRPSLRSLRSLLRPGACSQRLPRLPRGQVGTRAEDGSSQSGSLASPLLGLCLSPPHSVVPRPLVAPTRRPGGTPCRCPQALHTAPGEASSCPGTPRPKQSQGPVESPGPRGVTRPAFRALQPGILSHSSVGRGPPAQGVSELACPGRGPGPHGPTHPVAAVVRRLSGQQVALTPSQARGLSPDPLEDQGPRRGRGVPGHLCGSSTQQQMVTEHRSPGWRPPAPHSSTDWPRAGGQVSSAGPGRPGLPGQGFLGQVRPEAHDPRGVSLGQGARGPHNQARVS